MATLDYQLSVTVAPGGLTKKAMALLASILVVSYALFFYMQLSEERRIRASLFEQQTKSSHAHLRTCHSAYLLT